jgi:hypothetical protein
MSLPTVSRTADGDDDDAGEMLAGGPSAPLTLRHERPSAEPSEEQAPAPTTAATASIAEGGGASHGTAVVARPVSVARLTDAGSTTNVGGLVGAQSLLQRNVQRSVDGAPRISPTPPSSSTVDGPVGALANGATPATASAIGDFASAVSAAGSAESAPASFALSTRRPATGSATGLPVASRSVQRAVVQQLPAAELPLAPTRGPSQASIEATAMAVAQRAIDARAEDAPAAAAPVQLQAPVQRAVTIDEVSTEAGSTGSTAGASSATAQSPAELEQLATKLWGRLRLQLRRELLADRERAGMLTDLH